MRNHQKTHCFTMFLKVEVGKNEPKSIKFPIENPLKNIVNFRKVFYLILRSFWEQFRLHFAKPNPDSLKNPPREI